ncbi:MAG: response regulator [Defluviitaleaceae bacterium]|nr:response regulator [Defluviitaleaceae bacterium]
MSPKIIQAKDVAAQIREVEEMNELFLSASPLLMNIWGKDYNCISVSQQAVKMFGLSNAEEYGERFFELSPKLQPCGTFSEVKAKNYIDQGFAEGSVNFEWVHQTLDGDPFPAEVELVRLVRGGEQWLLAYVMDMRPVKAALLMDNELKREMEITEDVKAILNAAPIAITMYDENHKLVGCNPALADMFGYDDRVEFIEDFEGKIASDFSPEFQPCGTRSTDKLTQIIQEAVEFGHVSFEWVHRDRKGEEFPSKITVVRLDIRESHLLVVYQIDLRDIRAAQEKESEVYELNQVILDSSPYVIGLWDDKGNVISVNDQAREFFGIDDPMEVGRRLYDFSPALQPCGTPTPKLAEFWAKKAYAEGYAHFEWMHKTPEGGPLPVDCIYKAFTHKGKQMMLSFTRDLREIKAAQAKEREVNERAKFMLDVAPLIIQYWDREFKPIDCNQMTLVFYGFRDKNEYFEKFRDALPDLQPDGTPSWEKWTFFLKDIYEKGFNRIEFMETNLNGEPTFFEVLGMRIKYNGEIVILTYSTDITSVKKMEMERRRLLVVEESSKAKSLFLARISHEIRTPITAVLGISDIHLQNPDLSSDMVAAFYKIQNSSNLLLGIINDILDLSRIEAGKMTVLNESYSIESLVNDTVHLHLIRFENTNITFEISVDENLPDFLWGDVIRIQQIINNLLSNALKYTDSGKVSMTLRRLFDGNGDILLQIVISDTGMGMTQEQVDNIYDAYSRFHEDVDRYIGGTGLGMPIVHSLVQLMDAKIDISSTVNKGTTVTVTIPQKADSDKVLGKDAASRLEKFESYTPANQFSFMTESMPYGKVLVVDDVPTNLYVIKGLLGFYDLTVETCVDGYEAIVKISKGYDYDIIFMDHMMPGINGIETMRRIRRMGYKNPIVALTANAMIGQEEVFIKHGFDDFISKPIQTKRLNAILIKHIKDKQSPETLKAVALENKTRPTVSGARNIENFQTNASVQNKLRADFSKNQRHSVRDIIQALESGDTNSAHRLTHTLKGLAALIQEHTLSEVAEQAENCIENGERLSDELLTLLQNELDRVLENRSSGGEVISVPGNFKPGSHGANINAALNELDKLKPLLDLRKAESISAINELKKVPEAAILVRQVEKFEFANAAKSLGILRDILEEHHITTQKLN